MNNSNYENFVLQVVKEGNLTKAAEKLGISQPALSAGLSALERKLGFQVFNRRVSPIQLTAEGELYYEYIHKKNALTADFEKRIDVIRERRDFSVTIGAPAVYAETLAAKAVRDLTHAHPEFKISLRTSSLPKLIEMAENGQIDCLISTSNSLPNSFEKTEIKQERIFLCVPRQWEINEKLSMETEKERPIQDFTILENTNFVLLESNQPIQILLDRFLTDQNCYLRSSITVDQVSTAVTLATMGVGCCFASEDALDSNTIREKLRIYSLPEALNGRRIYAAWNRDFYQTQACRELLWLLAI